MCVCVRERERSDHKKASWELVTIVNVVANEVQLL